MSKTGEYPLRAFAGVLLLCSCVATTAVEVPVVVGAGSTFDAVVHTEATESGSANGHIAVLAPCDWELISVHGEGYGYSGPFLEETYFAEYLTVTLPPPSGYEWESFSLFGEQLNGEPGDVGVALLIIQAGEASGSVDLEFLAGVTGGIGDPLWDGEPYRCSIDVAQSLDQSTWGGIKAGQP